MPTFDGNHCCLCSQELPPPCTESPEVQKVFPKGLKTLKKIARQRDLPDLLAYLRTVEASGSPLYVHFQCRRKFTDARRLSSDRPEHPKKLRSIEQFDWKSCCLFCGVKRDAKHEEKQEMEKCHDNGIERKHHGKREDR